MRGTTGLRLNSAIWTAPAALGLVLLYFFTGFLSDFRFIEDGLYDASTVTSYALSSVYAVTYAVASSLAAWESGRLVRDGVWRLAPARSQVHVAFNALLPVLLLAWSMLLLPVVLALARQDTMPTGGCLILPLLGMAVATAHVIIGFLVGRVVPRLVATPVLAVLVFYGVAASWSREPFWLRHVSGQWPAELAFAELPTVEALLPHVLFIGSIALGAMLMWAHGQSALRRTAVLLAGVAVAVGGTWTSYAVARDWGPAPPLSTGHASVVCTGRAPEICLPEAAGIKGTSLRSDVVAVLNRLAQAGVAIRQPTKVSDDVLNGQSDRPSTRAVWWLPLTESHATGTTRFTVLRQAVALPCSSPDPVAGRSAVLWAATVVGEGDAYVKWQSQELQQFSTGEQILDTAIERVTDAQALPPAEQAAWYAAEAGRACDGRGSGWAAS
ncbi:hypothetical protein [Streptomyces niveus]|uniref:hypothetical protein n=1 Tax=Streptomyces niveus TaxID=193462 RepID=UPI0033B7AA4C